MEKEDYKDELLKYYGNKDISEKDILKVREIFKNSGAYDYSNKLMNDLYDEALNCLKNIKWIDEDNKKILFGFVEYLRKRNK
jgi:geranylgeranyl pyrophosphate synthase